MSNTTAGQATAENAHEAWLVETYEQYAEARIDDLRSQANALEAALARAPVQIRRLTRSQGQKLGIHF